MSNLEKQLSAIMRCLAAENEADREQAREELRQIIDGTEPVAQKDITSVIQDILADIGVPGNVKGYRYLITAISMAVEDPYIINAMTSALYPAVAEKHSDTASRVERAIRHAIENGFMRIDYRTMVSYFGNTISAAKGKPTNSEFIARVATIVGQRMKGAA